MTHVNHDMFLNKDGLPSGGIEVEVSKPTETVVQVKVKEQLDEKKSKADWYNHGLSAIRLAVSAGSKIYANKQKAKMAMSEAQLLHAEKQARGEEQYPGKLLEARQSTGKTRRYS